MVTKKEEKYIYGTESAWSDGNKTLLCLKTGDWRTSRPVVNYDTCNVCGICMTYCPTKAITMTPEGEYADDCTIN